METFLAPLFCSLQLACEFDNPETDPSDYEYDGRYFVDHIGNVVGRSMPFFKDIPNSKFHAEHFINYTLYKGTLGLPMKKAGCSKTTSLREEEPFKTFLSIVGRYDGNVPGYAACS